MYNNINISLEDRTVLFTNISQNIFLMNAYRFEDAQRLLGLKKAGYERGLDIYVSEYFRLNRPMGRIFQDEDPLPDWWPDDIPDPNKRKDDDRPYTPPGQPAVPPRRSPPTWRIPPPTRNPDLPDRPPATL